MKSFIKKNGKLILPVAIIAIIFIIGYCLLSVPKYIATSATIEAGKTFRANDFLLEEGHQAEFTSDFASKYAKDGIAQINKVGKHSVGLIVDGREYDIPLNVQDTIAPKASARSIMICQGDNLTAEDCVTNIEDVTKVSFTFKNEPALTKIGETNETVVLTDEGGNSSEIPVTITVIDANERLATQCTIEAGESIPTVEEIIVFKRTGTYITDLSAINTSLVGTHTLQVEVEGKIYSTKLVIEDTIAPTGTVTPVVAIYGTTFPTADTFITNIVDVGPVKVSYATNPGATAKDQNVVQVALTDQAGNQTIYDCECTVVRDDQAPTFLTYPTTLEITEGDSIIWRSQVTAEDNSGTVNLSLDTRGVNLKTPGTYTVNFVAKDPAGNVTKQPVTLIINEFVVTQEIMDGICEKITSKLIKPGMSHKERLYAIWKYVFYQIKYVNTNDHDEFIKMAYNGLAGTKNGDCYTFCASAQMLLEYIGYDTQVVRRRADVIAESGSTHVWLLVNIGTAANPVYYHFDGTPIRRPYERITYMMTDAQLAAYTKFRADGADPKLHFYTFDTSLYPASATEIMVDLNIDAKYYQ